MKKRTFIYLIALCLVSFIISSYSHGAASNGYDCTGAETGLGNPAGCSCHNAGTTTTVTIELDSAGTPTTHYKGGKTYTVKITGKNTSTTSLPKFGFQLGVIKGSAAVTTPVNAGSFTAPYPTGTSYNAPSSGNYVVGLVEQTSAQTATTGSGGSGTTYVETFNWTAPVAGTGTISFWGVVNAVNGDGGTSGDKYNLNHVIINEWPLGTGIAGIETASDFNFTLFPNPTTDKIYLRYNLEKSSHVSLTLYDIAGKFVMELQNGTINAGEQQIDANVSSLQKGIYIVTLTVDGVKTTKRIIVQ